jgi:hypothetical protein
LLVGLTDRHLRRVCCRHSLRHHHLCHAVHIKAIGNAAGNHVGSQGDLLDLRIACEVGSKERSAGTAAKVAGKVGEAGDLVSFAGRHADVVQRADRYEDEGETDHLKHTPEGDGSKGGIEIEACEVEDTDCGDQVAEADHKPGVDFAEASARDEHHQHHDEACRGKDHAGAFGCVAQESLEVLWYEDGRAEEDHTEDKL